VLACKAMLLVSFQYFASNEQQIEKKNRRSSQSGSEFPSRDSDPESLEYEAGVPTTQLPLPV